MAVNILLNMKALLDASILSLPLMAAPPEDPVKPDVIQEQVQTLIDAGWNFKHGILSVTGIGPKGHMVQESMPALIGQVLAGKVTGNAASLFYHRLAAFIQKCYQAQTFDAQSVAPEAPAPSNEPSPVDAPVAKPSVVTAKVPPSPAEIKATVTEQAAQGKSPVSLADAKILGQLVPGTNATNLYRVVGLGPHINIAARRSEGGVSVRVEGPGLKDTQVVNSLTSLGFTVNAKHASIHAATSKDLPAEILLGAVVFGLGKFFVTVTPPYEIHNV